jgi:WD40 repeat protein
VVYDLADDSKQFISLGGQPMLSATCNHDGTTLYKLQKDGSILRLEIAADNQTKWTRMSYTAQECTKIAVSPDGNQLALFDEPNRSLRIVQATTGDSIAEYTNAVAMVWDPKAKANPTAAIAYADGKLKIVNAAGVEELESVRLEVGEQIQSLNSFTENFRNLETAPVQYVMVHTQKIDGVELGSGRLHFIPRDIGVEGNRNATWVQSIGAGTKEITVSPTDSVFVTGEDSGAVRVWFASPTWKKVDRLFDLEGHQGSAIECIAFNEDGKTLITSDSAKRLLGWMSEDKQTKQAIPK